jgi:hypothetical protein
MSDLVLANRAADWRRLKALARSTITEQGDFFGFGIHREDLPEQKHKAGGAPFQTKAMWDPSGGRRRQEERGDTPVRSQKRGPAQRVHSQIGKQKAVATIQPVACTIPSARATKSGATAGAVNADRPAQRRSACFRKRRIQNWPR